MPAAPARQLPRLPQARDRAVAGAHPALPQRRLPRHLRLLQDGDGGRERRHAPDRRARGACAWRASTRTWCSASRCAVGRSASGDSGVMPLDIALDVAEEVGLPVMAHLDAPPPSRREVVDRLRPGDILTHCFRPFPNAPVRARRQGARGDPGGPRARRDLRHRPWRRLVRLRHDARHAGGGLPARRDLLATCT